MDTMAAFYNNLFAVAITVFGIIAAAIFVFLQIVYSQFSYREVYGIFKGGFLVLVVVISVITLLSTATGSLLLSFPQLNPTLHDVFRSSIVATLLVILFLLSLALFAVFTFRNISKIRPSRVTLLLSKRIGNELIKNYLLKKYGVPAPDDWLHILKQYREDSIFLRATELESQNNHKMSAEERAQRESEKHQLEGILSENKKTYERVKKTVEHAQDPIEPLDALMLRAINNVDLATIDEIQSVLLRMSSDFINSCKGEDSEEWSPESGIMQKYLEYLTDLLRTHLSMCDRQKLDLVKIRILENTEKVAEQVVAANAVEIIVILTFWKQTADAAIGTSREVFNKIIQLYRSLADYAFENGIADNETWLVEIFRHLGWLGERLISRQGIEEKPLMLDRYYSDEYDQLFEVLLSYGRKYNEYPTSYPKIYFDALDVVFLQIISVLKKAQSTRLEEDIFSCLYVYSSFAEAAILKGNSNGAALATNRLKESYDNLVSGGLEKSAKEAIGLLVTIGGKAARHKDKLQKGDFVRGGLIDQDIMDIAATSPFRDKISSTVWEDYTGEDVDWDFVVEMGKRLGTNFGFMFDWTTGELYPKDDPRRR